MLFGGRLGCFSSSLSSCSSLRCFSRFHGPDGVVLIGDSITSKWQGSIERNLASLAETAEQHGIRVVLATLPPPVDMILTNHPLWKSPAITESCPATTKSKH
jgi:hypothetical protein